MAVSPSETEMEHIDDGQETMFDSAAEFPGHDWIDSDLAELAETGTADADAPAHDALNHAHARNHPGLSDDPLFGRVDLDDAAFDGAGLGGGLDHDSSELEDQTALEVQIDLKSQLDRETALSSPVNPNPDPDPAPEPNPIPDPDPEPLNLPLTIADFTALEERVLRAVELVRRERQERISAQQRFELAEGRAAAAEAQVLALDSELLELKAHAPAVEQLQQEVDSLRQEREQVRQRVERLLGQLDALEL